MAYSAVSSPKCIPADKKMIMFIAMITSVMVKLVFLSVYRASTSSPSIAQPPRMARPIPSPRKKPQVVY